jgi:hypothetical protein
VVWGGHFCPRGLLHGGMLPLPKNSRSLDAVCASVDGSRIPLEMTTLCLNRELDDQQEKF